MSLGAVDFVIDCETLEEVLSIFEELDLWLELARLPVSRSDRVTKFEDNLEVLGSYGVEVRSVQAYKLHELSIVSPRREERIAAVEHIKEKIELAGRIGAKRVVTVPAYGYSHAANARDICVKSFRELADYASDYGVGIAIEALSPRRTSFLPRLREVVALVRDIDRENVYAMADTMHLYDAGEDVAEVIAEYGAEIAELHLKDTESLPPGKGSINFEQVFAQELNAEVCLEYRSSGEEALREVVSFIRSLLAR
jgi:sugar phosphate isomerase/epimerase